MAQLPKGGLERGHDKPIHGSCAIYFPGGIVSMDGLVGNNQVTIQKNPPVLTTCGTEVILRIGSLTESLEARNGRRNRLAFRDDVETSENIHFRCIESDQIIATSHDLTPNGGLVREIPLFLSMGKSQKNNLIFSDP